MRPVFLIFSLVCLVSCFNQGDCLITSTNFVKVAIKKKLDGTSKPTTFLKVQEVHDTVTLDFLSLERTALAAVPLPLNPNAIETTFIFLTSDSLTFHLTLSYSHYSRIVSTDCGVFIYYKDLKVKDTDFDSTRIVNSQLLKSVTTNLEVFY